jgi:hypothetical protein
MIQSHKNQQKKNGVYRIVQIRKEKEKAEAKLE